MADGLHVLLIEDDPTVRETVAAMLVHLGHRVETAGDGIEGLDKLRKAVPDVVVTDIIMPGKEGIETIMEIRRTHAQVKVIAMSGGGPTRNMDFLRFAERLGAHAIIPKPFGLEDLQHALRRVVDPER